MIALINYTLRYLASSGLDGCVIIWNAQSFLLHKRLESNPSRPLKGVAWDPRGEFVSAQSNEGHLYIWRTSDWRLESIFSTPYTTIPIEGYTYFARPSWSPDGCVICVPDIVNGQDTVAALVERGTWATEQSLVGHACSVQVCSFSPHLYVPTQNQLRVSETLIESQNYIMLIAMGSQDGVLSLWATNETRPIAVVAGLFDHAIMDISWDPMHPLILYVSSYNGTVVKVSIPHDFIEPLPTDQKNIILKAIAEGVRGANESRSLLNLPTSATQVTLQTDTMGSIECAIAVADKLKGETPTSETKIEQKLPAIQTTTVGGKRRITPQLVQPPISSILSDHRSESHKNPAFSLSNQPLTPSVQYSIAIGRPLRKAWLKVPQPQISILTGPFEITNKKSATNNDSFICHISSPSDVSKEYNITWEESLDGVLITNAVAFHFEVMNYSKDTHRHSTIDTEKKVHLESSAKRFKVGLIVSTNDNRIHMFSETGRRLMPPLVVPSAVTFLAVNTDSDETIQIHTSKYANEYPLKKNQSDGPSPSYCAAVLDNGLFFIWTLPTMDVLVADEICPGNFCGDLLGISIRTVLESTVKIYVEFNLSNNSSLLYSASQKLFVDLTPKTDADSLAIECLYGLKETNFNENEVLTAVNRLLSAADSVVLRRASTAFLEAQVGAANLLRDVQRLMGWVPALAHRLSVDESYAKCSELLEELAWSASIIEVLRRVYAGSTNPMIRRLSDQCHQRIFES